MDLRTAHAREALGRLQRGAETAPRTAVNMLVERGEQAAVRIDLDDARVGSRYARRAPGHLDQSILAKAFRANRPPKTSPTNPPPPYWNDPAQSLLSPHV